MVSSDVPWLSCGGVSALCFFMKPFFCRLLLLPCYAACCCFLLLPCYAACCCLLHHCCPCSCVFSFFFGHTCFGFLVAFPTRTSFFLFFRSYSSIKRTKTYYLLHYYYVVPYHIPGRKKSRPKRTNG
jgi:hypothetical protein